MRRLLRPLLLGAALAGAAGGAGARPAHRAPVVVELYTAQGCSACPQADTLLGALAARRGVIALTFPVDYWDYLGWADTFARPANTQRQRAYAAKLTVREIYTPEVVVDGAAEASGADGAAVDALIAAQADRRAAGPRVELLRGGARVRVSPGPERAPRSDVWLVRYDPAERQVKVKAGENTGKTVVQKNVVRELKRLGGYAGGARSYVVPKADGTDALSTLVLVQAAHGGPILAVAAARS